MNPLAKLAKKQLIEFSREIGIDAIGFLRAEELSELREYLIKHKEQNYATGWEHPDIEKRVNPFHVVRKAKSIIVIAMSYNSEEKGIQATQTCDTRGRIAKAAWGQDYHKVLHAKLEKIDQFIKTSMDANAENFACVDTGPFVDRELAVKAGIGFYGYHCNIIHPTLGSYIFLGSLVTTIDIEPDQQNTKIKCNDCQLCLQACPTGAIFAPYKINSKKCLAYLTLTKGECGHSYQEFLTDQVYGCDICQRICPHNASATTCKENDFIETDDVRYPDLLELLTISNKDFQKKYGHTSGAWRGKKPWQRNAILLLGKRKVKEAIPVLEQVIQTDPREDMRKLATVILAQLKEASI